MASAPAVLDPTKTAKFGSDTFESAFPGYMATDPNTRVKQAALPDHTKLTAAMREEIEEGLTAQGVAPVTVINMHNFALRINGGPLCRTVIQPCPTGELFTSHVLRTIEWAYKDRGANPEDIDQFDPVPVLPVQQAHEFVQEFNTKQGVGGVVAFVGDYDPTADVTVEMPEEHSTVRGLKSVRLKQRSLKKAMADARIKMEKSYVRLYNEANQWWGIPAKRAEVQGQHIHAAQYLFAHNKITALPDYANKAKSVTGKPAETCTCGTPILDGAIICAKCNWPSNPFECFKAARIEFGHVSMDNMTEKEWAEATAINEAREKRKAARQGSAVKGKGKPAAAEVEAVK